jgi:hypothetical protein
MLVEYYDAVYNYADCLYIEYCDEYCYAVTMLIPTTL